MPKPKSQSHDFEGRSFPFASIQSFNVALYWLYITQTEKYSQTVPLCAQYYSKQCSRNMLIHVHVYPFFLFEKKLYYWYNFSVNLQLQIRFLNFLKRVI